MDSMTRADGRTLQRNAWRRFVWANLRFLVGGGYRLPQAHRLPLAPDRSGRLVSGSFFGICVASATDPACDRYVIERLRELGIDRVRLDYSPAGAASHAERFLETLLDEGFHVCLHLVQSRAEARRMREAEPRQRWRAFVVRTLDRHGARLDRLEIGSTCNRRAWTGYTLETFLSAWRIAHEEAARRSVRTAAPNVTDFEPVYNVGLLEIARQDGRLPDAHSTNLFLERATEPEAYDHKILGRRLAPLLKWNGVKKAALLRRITQRAGVAELMGGHVAWSERRIRRRLGDPWQKQADYLQRYLCLMAAAGAFDRVYWGPLIGQREGLVDDGTRHYPDRPHVALYETVPGTVSGFRIRPAFHALQTTVRHLTGQRFVRDHAEGDGLHVLEFRGERDWLHVVWTRNGCGFDPRSWYEESALEQAEVATRDGVGATGFPCLIGESPVFLRWRGAPPAVHRLPPRLCPDLRVHAGPQSPLWPVRDARWQGVVRGLPGCDRAASLACLHPDAQEPSAGATLLRDGRNQVWSRRLATADGLAVVVKRARARSRLRHLLDWRKPSRARRSWNAACELERRGLATPRPLAFFETTDRPRGGAGLYLCAALSGAEPVRAALNAFAGGAAAFAGMAKPDYYAALSRFVRALHDRGVYFRDLSAGNILMRVESDGVPAFWLIDTTRAVFRSGSLPCRQRLADLKRLCHRLPWPERRAFLRQHCKKTSALAWLRIHIVFTLYDAKHILKQRLKPWRGKIASATMGGGLNR